MSPEELLGKRLFEDADLSEPRGVSCASCHDATRAFQGNNGSPVGAVARGSREGQLGRRNTPSLLYAMYSPPFGFVLSERENATSRQNYVPVGGFFWDGRARTLDEQAASPLLNPREMNNPTKARVVEKVRASAYADLAQRVLGATRLDDGDRGFDALGRAIAAFERTARFRPFRSKFDDVLRGSADLSPSEARGFALFKDPYKGNCLSCHQGKVDSKDPRDWLFTDFTYSALGVPRNRSLADNANPTSYDLGLCEQTQLAAEAPPGIDVQSLCGAFRVPSLRNVAVTPPYMHNGYFTELRDVVRFYVTRDTQLERWYPIDAHFFAERFDDLPRPLRLNVSTDEVPYDRVRGQEPRLDPFEIDDVVAFLGTLTDR